MKNKSESKETSTTSKCPYCGKSHTEKWLYCSNKCVSQARKRQDMESKLLSQEERNVERAFALCEMKRQLFAEQLIVEGYNIDWDYLTNKQARQDFEDRWYPVKMV
jgi:hypothetical protein